MPALRIAVQAHSAATTLGCCEPRHAEPQGGAWCMCNMQHCLGQD